ncbi:hypothetical protein [Metabacillus litoralis]|uniref:hypothetical protein n=1 Tax=Metabacillus litoralis TaxID=152268 RepID=UPI001315127C|nr:hypothetical protein [Metabacillus litoralis]
MNISEKLTSQQLQEILMNIYVIGQESDEINVKDVLKEIMEQILFEVNKSF